MANLSVGGISKFRRWYTQYKAIHGMEPPQDLMDSYLAAEMESEQAGQDRSRQISLQEKSLDITKDYQDRSLAQRDKEFVEQQRLLNKKLKAQEQANTITGIKDLTTLGMEVGKNTNWYGMGARKGGVGSSPGGDYGGYNPYVAGGVSSGLGATGMTQSGLDLSKYSLTGGGEAFNAGQYTLGAGADTGFNTGNYSLGSGRTSFNYGGLLAAAGGLGIEATQQPVTDWIGETSLSQGGKGTARTATTNADVWAGVGKGAAAGYGLGGSLSAGGGSTYAGAGAGLGAMVGYETSAYPYISGNEAYGNKFWKDLGIGLAAGGLPVTGVAGLNRALFNNNPERIKKAQDVGKAALLTGGGSLVLGKSGSVEKIKKKLKSIF